MPRKSSKNPRSKRNSKSKSQSQSQSQSEYENQSYNQNHNQNQNQNQNQTGGAPGDAPAAPPTASVITPQVLAQAGKMAEQLIGNAMTQNTAMTGGSALKGSEISASSDMGAGIKTAMVGGAVAGAVVGAEAYSSLKGSEIVGGRKRRRGSSRGRGSQSQSQSQSQSGGMIPGLLSAVETALVPLGLYLGQKALQSRRSGSSSLGKSFDFRRSSRRTRRRR